MSLTITVYGLPAPQGSKRHVGNGVMIESSKKVKPWREAVVAATIEAMGGPAARRISGPVEVRMAFTMPKPKSAPKSRRTWPQGRPDLSKLVRSTEDALTTAGAYEDDARIVRCVSMKMFPGEGTDSLPVPGVVVQIRQAAE